MQMEEYDQDFLTFTVKDEPDSENEEFIGFEDTSPYVNAYKQFILSSAQKKMEEDQLINAFIVEDDEYTEDAELGESDSQIIAPEAKEEYLDQKGTLVFDDVEYIIDDDEYNEIEDRIAQTNLKIRKVIAKRTNNKSRQVQNVETSLIADHSSVEDFNGVRVYICDFCGVKYTRKSKLRTHMLNHIIKGPNDLPLCEFCGEVFDSIDKFFKHFEETHNANAEDVLITFKQVKSVLCCEYCSNAYDYPEALTKHRSIHSGHAKPYSCQFCANRFDAYSKLVTHSLKHNDVKTDYPVDRYWMCDFNGCSKALKNITSLNYHKKNVHQKKYTSQCKICSEIFENSWSLHNHMQVKHLGPFPCSVCERSCPTTKLLKRHMLTHTKSDDRQNPTRRFVNYCKYLQVDGSGKVTCKECQLTFETRKRFRMHVVECHDKTKHFFCDQCEKGFTLQWQLNSHVENTHTKKFQCNICGVYKNKQIKLEQHMKIHLFPCNCCDRSFSKQQYLDSHIKKRHVSKLICGNFEQKVLNKCEYVDSNGLRRPQPTKIYVMPGPCSDGPMASQTPIRTIDVNIGENKKLFVKSLSAINQQPANDTNDQQNLENLAAIAFIESEMSQAAKLLTMPFINK